MDILDETGLGSKEFFQSQRLFSLAFVKMLNKMGPVYTKANLKKIFTESTFLLFPKELTEENLNFTIMNFKSEDVKFK